MPAAGMVKTPSNGKAKESLQKSAERTTSNGKKFVQTRLPFKMITPSGAATSTASSVEPTAVVNLDEDDPPPATREPRKRKLSFDDDETPPKEGTGCSKEHGLLEKENLNLSGATATKKVKTTAGEEAEDVEDQVIELNDDDDDDAEDKDKDRNDKVVVEAPPKKSKAAKAKASKSGAAAAAKEKPEAKAKEKASPAPIQIKWPLANKRPKRRKSLKKAEEGATADASSPKDSSKVGSESSDDIEIIAEELNPQKKPKVQEPEKGKKKDQKEEQEAKEEQDEVMVVEVEDKQKKEKSQESPQETKKTTEATEVTATLSPAKKEKKATTEKEANAEAEISILSSSEGQNSSSDHEMDVDTEAAERVDAPPLRKSLPESSASATTSVDAQKMLTPKQQRLLEQRRKAREEKEQKLAEERRLKQQEKEQREQQRKLEREEKEQQRKLEREEKEQQKKVEREEKERKRQAEVDSKNEEKRKRNEAKEEVQRKKDEERRKKELEREEAEQKKKRAAESFTKFFVPKQPKSGNGGGGGGNGGANGGASSSYYLEHEQSSCDSTKAGSSQQTLLAFRPFQIKDDMLLAPVTRASLRHDHRLQLDQLFRDEQQLEDGEDSDAEEVDISRRKPPGRGHLYLSELSSGRHKPLKMLRDARLRKQAKEEEDDDVQVIGDDLATAGLPIEEEQPSKLVARMRAKYLHFADNRRPPYYGTWRKKSQTITARRPLAHDKVHFDYELDSDCEWEEEEPGESLSASEDEKEERESEEESEEEYNEWYVPHGHLSDEELQNDGDGADDGHTREAQKAKLQVLQQEFAQEMKKQTKKIKPRLLGPVWLDENGNQLEQLPAIFAHTIGTYACWSAEPSISLEPPPEPEREDLAPEPQLRPLQLDERLLQQLVRLTHGNRNSKTFLINEYLEYLKTQMEANRTLLPAKSVIREKIEELASWKTVELSSTPEAATAKTKSQKKPKKRLCWMVASEMLHKFQLQELTLHNQWDYTLTPKISETAGGGGGAEHEPSPSPAADASPVAAAQSPATTTISSATATTPNTTPVGLGKSGTKKRATLLMSVPRDQPIPSAAKNALISQFLRRQTEAKEKEKEKEKEEKLGQKPASVDEDVVLLSD